jgi:hypothetical protein
MAAMDDAPQRPPGGLEQCTLEELKIECVVKPHPVCAS